MVVVGVVTMLVLVVTIVVVEVLAVVVEEVGCSSGKESTGSSGIVTVTAVAVVMSGVVVG